MNTPYFPSSDEVEKRLEPIFATLRSETIYAQYEDPSAPPIDYRAIVGEKSHAMPKMSPNVPLFDDHFRFLADVAANLEDGLRVRYQRLGFGMERGNRILRELKEAGAITVNPVKRFHPTGGRERLVPTLTAGGRELLAAREQRLPHQPS